MDILAEEEGLFVEAFGGRECAGIEHYAAGVVLRGNAQIQPFIEDYARANVLSADDLDQVIESLALCWPGR
jgi:hypothetical protein